MVVGHDEFRVAFFLLLKEHADAHGVELKPARMNIYFNKLKRWPGGLILQATEDCFYSCSRFPTIQDIAKAYHSKNPT